MVKFKVPEDTRYDLATHFEIAERVARDISATFAPPIQLEFEKVYYPYMLYAKKRYAGAMYTRPETMDYIDVKGLSLVRRDFAPIAKTLSHAVLDALMLDKSPDKAVEVAQDFILRVLSGSLPLEEFVLSKTLRTGYKNDNLPHVAVARKIKARTGSAPHSGERIPYVFVKDDANPDALQSHRAEHPEHVRAMSLPLDVLYYIDHQVTSPLMGLLDVVVTDPMEAVFGCERIKNVLDALRKDHATLVKTAKRIRTNAGRQQYEITKFFCKG